MPRFPGMQVVEMTIRGVIYHRVCCVLSRLIAEVQRPKGRFITVLNKTSDFTGSCNERITAGTQKFV
ncbi:hypothetical protein OUZ56_021292 [Daphnia magna]|uniref:Uncharacterized protein n=1 Tax=Daphnia magna TaxID=35525 RepID=A0ABQ9ZGY4_9CRUS|nr:hypothetical protein OUZ56_021292 [Daphnia magna]